MPTEVEFTGGLKLFALTVETIKTVQTALDRIVKASELHKCIKVKILVVPRI